MSKRSRRRAARLAKGPIQVQGSRRAQLMPGDSGASFPSAGGAMQSGSNSATLGPQPSPTYDPSGRVVGPAWAGGPGNTASAAPAGPQNLQGSRAAASVPPGQLPSRYNQAAGQPPPTYVSDVDLSQNIWSPFQPVVPFGPPYVNYPRTYDYPVGLNLDFTSQGRLAFFKMLQAMSRSWGILRAVIETRKDQLMRIPWAIQLRDKPKAKNTRLDQLTDFFRRPDGEHDFDAWMRMQLEDKFVIDAANYYVWKDMVGRPLALMHLSGETIKPLIDDAGRRPAWPNPGWQQCFSEDTEILTKRGWLRRKDIDVRVDEFATRDRGGNFEWQKSTDLVVRDYVGSMYRFHGERHDQLVTPDHRMLVENVPILCGSTDRGEIVMTAQGLLDLSKSHPTQFEYVKIPMTSEWRGTEIGWKRFGGFLHEERCKKDVECQRLRDQGLSYAAIGERVGVSINTAHRACTRYVERDRKRQPKDVIPVEMSGDDFAAFMGAYLSEGSCNQYPGSIGVCISQKIGGKAFIAYEELLHRIMPGRVSYAANSFRFGSKPFHEYLCQFGHARDKWIPDEIMNATPKQLEIFWRYFNLGDGDASRMGRVFTSSRRMADQLQEIAEKIGKSATIREVRSKVRTIMDGGIERTISAEGPYYTVSMQRAVSAAIGQVGVERYRGKVWCPSVPNGFVYVRRNGRASWSGNCIKGLPWQNLDAYEFLYVPQRPTPQEPIYGYSEVNMIYVEILQGIKKMLYKLSFWDDGSIPQLMVTVPDNWSPEQLASFQAHFDFMMSGNIPFKSRVRFMPSNSKPFDLKNANGELLKTDEDEWNTRLVCYTFSVSPQPFVKQMNRSTAESAAQEAEEEGLHPLMSWVKTSLIDPVIQSPNLGFGYDDCEFVWQPEPEVDAQKQMVVLTGYVKDGIVTPDEAREELNRGPLPNGAGAEAVVITPNGPVPFSESLEANRQRALAVPDQLDAQQQMREQALEGQTASGAGGSPGQPPQKPGGPSRASSAGGSKDGKEVGKFSRGTFRASREEGWRGYGPAALADAGRHGPARRHEVGQ